MSFHMKDTTVPSIWVLLTAADTSLFSGQFLIPEMVHTATRAQFRQMPSALVPVNEGAHG